MAVSKRLRYEVLRRDGHACRYCGAAAPDARLTVDHVVPVALGGRDDPTNLVAACVDCNAGKSASSPDQPLVADVQADSLRWSRAMQIAAQGRRNELADLTDYIGEIDRLWREWKLTNGEPVDRPIDWQRSAEVFFGNQVAVEEWQYAVRRTMENPRIVSYKAWTYMCGILWSRLREQTEIAQAIAALNDTGDSDPWAD